MDETIGFLAWNWLPLAAVSIFAAWLGWNFGAWLARLRVLIAVRRRIREVERQMRDRGFERDALGNWRVRKGNES